MTDLSARFIIGMVLLTTNQVIGWGGIAFFAYLAKKTKKKAYLAWGTAVYAVSWGMLFLGAYLSGPEGIKLAKQYAGKFGWWLLAAALVIIGVIVYVKYAKKRRKKTKTPSAAA